MQELNKLTKQVLKYSFQVHTELEPGLLESSYKECLFYELNKNGIVTEKETALPFIYQEVKAVESLADIHTAQVLTYLKLSGCKIGLLLNFHSTHLKNGIKRLIL